MKTFKRNLFLFIPLLLPLSSVFAEETDGWQFRDESYGIKVFRKEVPGSPLLAFRGEGVVEAPIDRVSTVVFDTTRAPEWMPDLVESKILKWLDDDTFIEYDHVGMPIFIKDRDFVSEVKVLVDREKKRLLLVYKTTSDDALAPKTDYVRGNLMNTTFVFSKGSTPAETKVVGEVHVDPKGAIPKWLVNTFQTGWPVDTFQALRKQVKKTDIKADSRFADRVKLLD